MAEKVVEIRDLYKSFGDLDVLKGVDLDLFREENLVVLGRSGTGKSVLIKIMVGLLKQDKGQMNVLGQEVSTLHTKELNELRLKIGFSFQNSALYDSMTVRENMEFPLVRNIKNLTKKEITMRIEELLEAVGLPNTINQMPSELSGGQKKRIGVARTLILNPEIMLYDEPTAGLDPITCVDINNLINEVRERYKTTSIVITHDLTCAKMTGDRMAVLLDGQFSSIGTFEEVFPHAEDKRVKSFYDYNFIES
ncbi:ABC transporter ATP-binding protein [Algoriphagus zhangzhouensis]|uniref:Phospholipid/cholesterol/gamma-HCH transport system ATP-binding protein n=1 Tax=Algoriphagus zhangzhouensis TaxID=1073327 RepID=A0A1M7ZE92_9BACT|nr:ATP-binding cassette domain-containing protein [Algoriphagus zhangzhouensis]TDY46005.1 phospholipid/cholesterol/gamma-HCH transport system ATP-binding protein [Algoriphagus zhangzhouensis]SHO63225.1 phospholipid/cholesterol/gamma-HCH transport system ATP-binding protein [Algoriphagus zhangzhouensis]